MSIRKGITPVGWKNVKEHYKIGHFVTIKPEWDDFARAPSGHKLLCIGSPMCHDLISVNLTTWLTTWKFKTAMSPPLQNVDLQRYWDEMSADVGLLGDLVAAPDTFEKSILVYTYEDGEIIECKCEELGWPNVTHDGQMMYENMFFADRADAVAAGTRNAKARIESDERWLAECEENLAKARSRIIKDRGDLTKLESASALA